LILSLSLIFGMPIVFLVLWIPSYIFWDKNDNDTTTKNISEKVIDVGTATTTRMMIKSAKIVMFSSWVPPLILTGMLLCRLYSQKVNGFFLV